MKIRTGFVSNSSSSSFIVNAKNYDYETKKDIKLLTAKEKKILLKEGFVDTEYEFIHAVSCNQDEIIDILIENNISFKSDIHYNQQFMQFDRDKKTVVLANNYGEEISMHGYESMKECEEYRKKQEPYKRITLRQYLKESNKKQLMKKLYPKKRRASPKN